MNIVVVGGGTAGWLTALYAKKIFSNDNIILIESEEIGILGAGEGSTPNFIDLLDFLEIPTSKLIKNCNSTIKNGIKFTNWTKDGDYYHHNFDSKNYASNDYNFKQSNNFIENDTNFSHYISILQNDKVKDYAFMDKLSENFSVPFIKLNGFCSEEKILDFNVIGSWSLHFDATLLAKYLKSIGEKRGIVRKEGVVKQILNDNEGNIYKIETNNDQILCDFVFDCTGLKRLIIGNHYKSKWKSHSKFLPAKKALPFFLEIDKDIPPYTEAIAMDYGWIWKIPLQNRYGCGYVYDSNYLSDEDAKKEIENYLGFEPIYPRKDKGAFNFEAGCFESIWIKNCLSVGLSSGFIEPLEATSIMQSIIILKRFISNKENLITNNNYIKQQFNELFIKETDEIVNFLYLHYITNKKNTPFWENFTKNNKIPDFCKYIVEVCNDKTLSHSFDFVEQKIFGALQYYYILLGNEIIKKQKMLKQTNNFHDLNQKIKDYTHIKNSQELVVSSAINHKEFIDYLKS